MPVFTVILSRLVLGESQTTEVGGTYTLLAFLPGGMVWMFCHSGKPKGEDGRTRAVHLKKHLQPQLCSVSFLMLSSL